MLDPNLIRLIEKYDTAVPRYTSYPTAVELSRNVDTERLQASLQHAVGTPVALYVHLPFCKSLCWFCACNNIVTQDVSVVATYLDDLRREIQLLREASRGKHVLDHIHLGGGSSTFLSGDELEALCAILDEGFSGFASARKSIECDPRTTTAEQIARLRSRGFMRASLGVQDFDPGVHELVHRVQPCEQVAQVVKALREAGFASVNFDLIYGLPGQSESSMRETIERVVALAPDRIALYGYAHVQWKVKVQRMFDKYPLPSPRERVELFSIAEELLTNAGYLAIGFDHFALPSDELAEHAEQGTLHRNFMGYTTVAGEGVLGIGVSSISDIGGTLYQNEVELDAYVTAVRSGKLPVTRVKHRNRQDLVRAYLIERIMCDGELRLEALPESLAEEARHIIADTLPALEPLMQDGLVAWDGDDDVLHATFTGRYFLRSIAAAFDTYVRRKDDKVFSNAL